MRLRHSYLCFPLLAGLAVAACDNERAPAPAPSAETSGEKRSIFRPEFQVEPIEALEEQSALTTVIRFPEGTELTEAARAELATVLASPQMKDGGPIVLRGHSDAGGRDAVNLRVSRERAEAVRDWMVENGVDAERIAVIAFGEQNPEAPNALPDGEPNEAGRAANRRVEIEIAGSAPAAPEEPTLAESLAEKNDESATGSSPETADERSTQ